MAIKISKTKLIKKKKVRIKNAGRTLECFFGKETKSKKLQFKIRGNFFHI